MSDLFSPQALAALVAASNPPAEVRQADVEAKPKKSPAWATLASVLGPLADGASTAWAMNQSGPNARIQERNPLYGSNPSAGKIMGIKAGQAALQGLLTHLIGKRSPTAAKIIGAGTGAIHGTVTGMNIKNGLKARELNKGGED